MKKIFNTIFSLLICFGLLSTNVFATEGKIITDKSKADILDEYTAQELTLIDGEVFLECGYSIDEHISVGREADASIESLICPCGGALSVNIVFTGQWYFTDNSGTCQDGKLHGHDYEQKQQEIRRYSCNNCKDKYELTSYNTQWICKGFN